MKTKELVRLLLMTDPDGESEVCVGNVDIIDVGNTEPCYFDGQFVQIVIDPNARTEDNEIGVVKVITRTKGSKINLKTMEIEEAFLENPKAVLEMEPYNPIRNDHWKTIVELWREEGRRLKKELREVEKSYLTE